MDARKQTKSPLNAGVALLILAALGVAIYLAITFSSRQTDDSARSASTGETTKNEPNSSSGGRETPPNFPASDSSPAGDSRLSPRPGATMAEEEADTSGTLSTTGITVGADGKPVPGVALEGWLVAPGLGNPGVVELPRTATSGPDGRFAFRKLPVKPERILKITAQAGSDWVIPEPVSVRPGDRDVRVQVIPVFSDGKIWGVVSDGGTNEPILGYRVLIQPLQGKSKPIEAITADKGKYSYEKLKTGAYKILSPPVQSGKSLRKITDPMHEANEGAYFGVVIISPQTPEAVRNLVIGGPLRVEGKVLEDPSGKGLAGLTISAVEGNEDSRYEPQRLLSTISGEDGTFAIENCAAAVRPSEGEGGMIGLYISGDYMLTDAKGGTERSYADIQKGFFWLNYEKADTQEIKGVVLRVAKATTLSGIVTNTEGVPFEGASVFHTDMPQMIRQSPSMIDIQQVTGKDGLFKIKVAPFKTIFAGAQTPRGGIFFSEPIAITDTGADTKIIVEGDTRIDGLVLDPEGNPVEGAEVTLLQTTGFSLQSVLSDKEGRFKLDRPAGAKTTVRAIKEGFFPSEAMDTERFDKGLPLILILGSSEFIQGRVVDESGSPLSEVKISLFGEGASDFKNQISPTSADGRFRIGPLKRGKSYSAVFSKENIDTVSHGLVPGGDEKTIVLKLSVVLDCIVKVTDPSGKPVTPYTVTLLADKQFPVNRNPSGPGPWTCQSEDGKIEIKVSPGADFYFEASSQGLGTSTSYKVNWDYASGLFNVNELSFEFPIVIGGYFNVTGRIVSQHTPDTGLAGIQLNLRPLSPRQGTSPAPVVTGADGSFTFEPVPTGGYELRATAPPRPDLVRPFYFTKAEEAGLGNIPWLGIGNLRVRVKEGTGQPLANAWVELISRGGNPPAQPTMQTDGNGDALWSDLPEGNYSLRLPVYNRIADALVQNGKTAEVPIMLGSYKLTSTVNYRGAPLQGAYVVLNSGVPGQQITGQTDVSGNVKFEGLAEGNYAVSVVWPEGFFSSQGIQYDPFSAPPQNIALRGEQQPDAIPNLVFNMPTGVISGAVSEDYIPTPENPPPYIELYLISQPTVRMNTHPDSLGFFFLPGLPAGQYRIEFTSDKSVGTYDYTLGEGQEISGIVLPQK